MPKVVLQWETWMYGLFSTLIGGGAGAVSAAIGVNLVDSKDWNLSTHPGHLLYLMGVCFCINGAISTFAYLSKSPLPTIVTTTTDKTVNVTDTGVKVKTVETTEEK